MRPDLFKGNKELSSTICVRDVSTAQKRALSSRVLEWNQEINKDKEEREESSWFNINYTMNGTR